MLHHLASCEIVDYNALLYSNHHAVQCVFDFNTFPTEVTGDLVDRVIRSKISEQEKDTYRLSLENDLGLHSLLLTNITCTDDIDFLYLALVRTAINTSNRCFSKRTYMPHLKPYWCQELTSLNKSLKICRQEWLQSGSPRIGPIFEKLKNHKRSFRESHRKAADKYMFKLYDDIDRAAEIDKEHFWHIVNPKPKSRQVVSGCKIMFNGKLCRDNSLS